MSSDTMGSHLTWLPYILWPNAWLLMVNGLLCSGCKRWRAPQQDPLIEVDGWTGFTFGGWSSSFLTTRHAHKLVRKHTFCLLPLWEVGWLWLTMMVLSVTSFLKGTKGPRFRDTRNEMRLKCLLSGVLCNFNTQIGTWLSWKFSIRPQV